MSYGTALLGKARLRQKTGCLSPLLGNASHSGAQGSDQLSWTGDHSLEAGLGPIQQVIHPKTPRGLLQQRKYQRFLPPMIFKSLFPQVFKHKRTGVVQPFNLNKCIPRWCLHFLKMPTICLHAVHIAYFNTTTIIKSEQIICSE